MLREYARFEKKGENEKEAFARLYEIVKVLRIKCPWDSVQTHDSLRTCMIEEAYEAVDAIQREDTDNLREELGDVLLQVIFHGILAEEEESFTLTDVINEECEKMLRRHPHIFLGEEVKGIDKALEKWDNMKSTEHGQTTYTDRLKSVPDALPALIKSNKVQSRAAKAGFDWDSIDGAFDKVSEELAEVKEAYAFGFCDEVYEELGDLLFSVVNVARFAGADPEDALNAATRKFIERFSRVEEAASRMGKRMDSMSLDELDALWENVKNK